MANSLPRWSQPYYYCVDCLHGRKLLPLFKSRLQIIDTTTKQITLLSTIQYSPSFSSSSPSSSSSLSSLTSSGDPTTATTTKPTTVSKLRQQHQHIQHQQRQQLHQQERYGLLHTKTQHGVETKVNEDTKNSNSNSSASSLLLFPNRSPSSSFAEISVHKGYRVQAALLVDRLPLVYEEAAADQRWRDFEQKWREETKSSLQLGDAITYMKQPYQFMLTVEQENKKRMMEQKLRDIIGGEVGEEQEGVQRKEGERKGRKPTDRSRRAEGGEELYDETDKLAARQDVMQTRETKTKQQLCYSSGESFGGLQPPPSSTSPSQTASSSSQDIRNLFRWPSNILYLVVLRQQQNEGGGVASGKWTLPCADRIHPQPMKQTLYQLCQDQLSGYRPYLVGNCPLLARKCRYSKQLTQQIGIKGNKVFLYRGHHIPGNSNVCVSGGCYEDYAWLTASELSQYLTESEYQHLKHTLYT
eukprot:GHVS01031102.1.p1 GENE.GHVS01031102.1~~GHVS01031102.1.p1  ORF type:complete len:490 (+),score=106.33 GHVS01031102.1:63-1472(+)